MLVFFFYEVSFLKLYKKSVAFSGVTFCSGLTDPFRFCKAKPPSPYTTSFTPKALTDGVSQYYPNTPNQGKVIVDILHGWEVLYCKFFPGYSYTCRNL